MKKHGSKKKVLRVLCTVLALCTAFSFSACDMLAGVLNSGDSSSSRPSTDEDTNISDKHSDKKDEDDSNSEEDTVDTNSDMNSDEDSGDTGSDGVGDIQDGAVGGNEENPIEPDYTPQAVEEKYGYQYLSSYEDDGVGLCGFYADLYETAKAFAASSETVESEKLAGLKDPYYLIGTLNYGEYGLSYEQASAVWRTVRAEYPEFYFLSNSLPYDTDEEVLYFAINEEYASHSVRVGINLALELLVEKCASYINAEATEEEKLISIHDFLTAELTYSFQSDNVTPSDEVWAHNIVGAAIQKEGVCETYAETFDYLCGVFGIECLTVVGAAGMDGNYGPHAWNIVRVGEDETAQWYSVDVTWDDGYGDGWVGREWFGKVGTEYENTHIADEPVEEWKLEWQFAIPTLAESSLSPVLLRENDNEAEWCLSVDEAFAKMTNGDSRYEITLASESQVLKNNDLAVYLADAEFITAQLPTVESITIKGKTIFTDETHVYPCELTAVNALTLTCETVLADCVLLAEMSIVNANRYFVYEEYGDWEPL